MFDNLHTDTLLEDVLVELPAITDARGSLSFVQQPALDFKRVFWIYGVPEGSERGGHAHRTCHELIFAVAGSFDLELFDGVHRKSFHLDRPNLGVIIRPNVWCRLYNFSSDFVGLCLASQEYSAEGYVNTIDDFVASCAADRT